MKTHVELISLLLDRPYEPVFLPKGQDRVELRIPANFVTKENQSLYEKGKVSNRVLPMNLDKLPLIPDIPHEKLPDLKDITLDKHDIFSVFIPSHQEQSSILIDIFLKAKDALELLAIAAYVRDRVNPLLYNYALSVVMLHKFDKPSIPVVAAKFPSNFIDSRALRKVAEKAHRQAGEPMALRAGKELDKEEGLIVWKGNITGSDLDEENRLWYFREDVGINSHHWHWHTVYPNTVIGHPELVAKDRRGELFYYMHRQIIARYNFERFSNQVKQVQRLNNLHLPIKEGYYPKLTTANASTNWTGRSAGVFLRDLNRSEVVLDVNLMNSWRQRILDAIDKGFVVDQDRKEITLDEKTGIDILGNMLEASMISPNRQYYGNFHNQGHNLIAYSHDPKGKYNETGGVMGAVETAMRDPAFYRWHSLIDDIFQAHKKLLKPYSEDELRFNDIELKSVSVKDDNYSPPGVFNTYYDRTVIDISGGLDFIPPSSGTVTPLKLVHLNHSSYTFTLEIDNKSNEQKLGMVRIFLAPKFNEKKDEYNLNDQRLFMVELDRFKATLNPGANTISRKSSESSVSIPFLSSLARNEDKNDFCKCGWPDHMMIPKGTKEGMQCQLYVMISDYQKDSVDPNEEFKSSEAYCGSEGKKYPDKRAMGFPFDRLVADRRMTLDGFVKPYKNMAAHNCQIVFKGDIQRGPTESFVPAEY